MPVPGKHIAKTIELGKGDMAERTTDFKTLENAPVEVLREINERAVLLG